MPSSRRILGFSMIELMVVIAIMMTVLGLVGNSVFSGVSRAEAQTETVSFYGMVRKSGVKAFTSGRPVLLKLERNTAILSGGNLPLDTTIVYEHLLFNNVVITFNTNGLPNISIIEVEVRGKETTFDFNQIFKRVGFLLISNINSVC
ncbi:MAG: prepilin-type N-terminal cleavage/methylation domain-containing protein [Porticoccaceae bacterium]|nr:prepilin-type N-terminal cleavage/methylation domain-containing protein [Porticoccaceae bacterium]